MTEPSLEDSRLLRQLKFALDFLTTDCENARRFTLMAPLVEPTVIQMAWDDAEIYVSPQPGV